MYNNNDFNKKKLSHYICQEKLKSFYIRPSLVLLSYISLNKSNDNY